MNFISFVHSHTSKLKNASKTFIIFGLKQIWLLDWTMIFVIECVTDLDYRSEMIIFWVNFDHFWSEHHFPRPLGQYENQLASSCKSLRNWILTKLSLPKSLICTVCLPNIMRKRCFKEVISKPNRYKIIRFVEKGRKKVVIKHLFLAHFINNVLKWNLI
jgi:hypothetical protein